MIHAISNGDSSSKFVERFRFDDFDVSWAGAGRNEAEFCFGTEDGKVLFTTLKVEITGGFAADDEDPEAVNGIAFIGDVIAVSTRQEISFWTNPTPGSAEAERVVFDCGAHGVIATTGGQFVAPLGPTGLMAMKPARGSKQFFNLCHVSGRKMDYYSVVDLSESRTEVVACALRQGGVGAASIGKGDSGGSIKSTTSTGIDVVDVCSLTTDSSPFATAALDRSGALVLFRDVLRDRSPTTIRFGQIHGVAYRVFSSRGGILILTSRGLFVLRGLASLFHAGEALERSSIPVLEIPLEAVDANLCWERWLLVVMSDHILRLDLNLLLDVTFTTDVTGEETAATLTLTYPTWDFHDDPAQLMAVAW